MGGKTITKECTVCHERKPLSGFYRDSDCRYGRHTQCKVCRRAYQAQWYQNNQARIAAHQREYREAVPEMVRARQAVARAIREGRLTRQPCEACGDELSQAHHDDYSKPLEVRWLCQRCHNELHRTQREKQHPCRGEIRC